MARLVLFFFYWALGAGIGACILMIRNIAIRIEKLEKKAESHEGSIRGLRLATGILSKRLDETN